MIALEALFVLDDERHPITRAMGERISKYWCGDGATKEEIDTIKEALGNAYKVRSAIVHGTIIEEAKLEQAHGILDQIARGVLGDFCTGQLDDFDPRNYWEPSVTLTLVAGLPGSGKTHLLMDLQRQGKVSSEDVFDDFHARANRDSPAPTASRFFGSLLAALAENRNCVVADSAFCDPVRRRAILKALKRFKVHFKTVELFFANDPMSCARNVRAQGERSDIKPRLGLISLLSAGYTIPSGAAVLPVFQSE